jgi:mannose-6-phosphate isomerase-like protein (cupin superfamily)
MAEVRYQRGDSDERPWGRWEVLDTGEGFAVKRITVKPGAGDAERRGAGNQS